MKKLNKTEYPMFVPLCVLCFQRQPLVCMGKAAAVWCNTKRLTRIDMNY